MEFNRLFQGSLHQADTAVSVVRSPCVDGVQQTVSRIPTPSWHCCFCSSFFLCWWSSTDCFKDPYTKLTLLFLQFVLPVFLELNRLFQGSLHQPDTSVSVVRSLCVDGVQQTVSRIPTPSWHFCFCSSFSLCWWSSTDCFKDPYTKLTLLFLQFVLPVVDGVQQTVSRIHTPSWHFCFCSSFSLCWWSSTDCFKDPYTKLTLLFLQFILPVLMEFNRLFQGSLHQADTSVSAVRSPSVDGIQQTVSRIPTPSWHFCFCSSFSLCWWSSTDCFKDPYTKLTLLFL